MACGQHPELLAEFFQVHPSAEVPAAEAFHAIVETVEDWNSPVMDTILKDLEAVVLVRNPAAHVLTIRLFDTIQHTRAREGIAQVPQAISAGNIRSQPSCFSSEADSSSRGCRSTLIAAAFAAASSVASRASRSCLRDRRMSAIEG